MPASPPHRGHVALLLLLASCSPSHFDGLTGGARDAGELGAPSSAEPPVDGGSAAVEDASLDASAASDGGPHEHAAEASDPVAQPDAESPGDASPDASGDDAGPPIETVLHVASDADDGQWCLSGGVLQERVHSLDIDGSPGYAIEVGADSEACSAGVIFRLPFGHGARVEHASLTLHRVSAEAGPHSGALAGATMRVSVFATADVQALDATHRHTDPAQHGEGGVWSGRSVGGFTVGAQSTDTESPELSLLVGHVLEAASPGADVRIGFLLTPEVMDGGWAQFADSFAGSATAPRLSLVYRPAP